MGDTRNVITAEVWEIHIDYGKGKNIQSMFTFDNFPDAIKCISETPEGMEWRMLVLMRKTAERNLSAAEYDVRVGAQSSGSQAVYYE